MTLTAVDSHRHRSLTLDVMRVTAILMVLMQHTCPLPRDAWGGHLWLLFNGSACDLLFMVSGILLLPVTGSTGGFYRRRFVRVGVPLLFWSAVYIALNSFLGGATGEVTLWEVKRVLFIPVFPPGWFVYAILGVYLLMPFVSPWIERAGEREFRWFAGIWLAAMCLPYVAERWNVPVTHEGILGLFYNYFGLTVIGVWLYRRVGKAMAGGRVAPLLGVAGCLAAVGWILPVALRDYAVEREATGLLLFEDLSLSTVAWTFACFVLIMLACRRAERGGDTWVKRLFRFLSVNSFGVYLVHHAFIRYLFEPYFPELTATWIFPAGVVALSLGATVVIRKLPVVGKYLC